MGKQEIMSPTDPDLESADPDEPTTGETDEHGQPFTEDDYAHGETSDPDGASRDVPAGEDHAGSGF